MLKRRPCLLYLFAPLGNCHCGKFTVASSLLLIGWNFVIWVPVEKKLFFCWPVLSSTNFRWSWSENLIGSKNSEQCLTSFKTIFYKIWPKKLVPTSKNILYRFTFLPEMLPTYALLKGWSHPRPFKLPHKNRISEAFFLWKLLYKTFFYKLPQKILYPRQYVLSETEVRSS